MYTDLKIPYEVVVFLLKKDVWDKNYSGDYTYFRTIILDKAKATKPKIERCIQDIISLNREIRNNNALYKFKDDDIITVTIRNNNFNLYIPEDDDRMYYGGDYCSFIGFNHKDVGDLPYKLTTPIGRDNIIALLYNCSYITNNIIHGNYLYSSNNFFCQYRPENLNLQENIFRVDSLGENKKTTKFIPGHIYLLKDKVKVLYLGTLDNIAYRIDNCWRNDDDHELFLNRMSSVYYKKNADNFLYINLDDVSKVAAIRNNELEKFFELYKGTNLSEFVSRWIEHWFNNHLDDIDYCLSYNDSLHGGGGIDLGEYLVQDMPGDDTDLDDIIHSFCMSNLENMVKSSPSKINKELLIRYSTCLGEDIVNLSDSTKDVISNVIVKPEVDRVFANSLYRLKDDVASKVKAETSNGLKIYELIKQHIGSYYIDILDQLYSHTDSLPGYLYKNRTDKLDTLIIESKNKNFSRK